MDSSNQNMSVSDIDLRLSKLRAKRLEHLKHESMRIYVPHPKQLEFHKSSAEIRAMVTGNKFGKTYAGAMDVSMHIGKIHPWRTNYLGSVFARACCVDFATLGETLIPIFREILPRKRCRMDWKTFEGNEAWWPGLRGGNWKDAYDRQNKILYLNESDGGKIEFKSYDQDRESFGGPVRHIVWHDEEPPEFVFGENMARQFTCEKNNILFTLTPLNYSKWLYTTLSEKAAYNSSIFMVEGSSYDNPYASEKSIAFVESMVENEAERQARIYGKFTFVAGRILPKYGDHNLIDDRPIPKEWPRIVAIDPHEEKPTCILWTAIDPYNNIPYVYREKKIRDDVETVCNAILMASAGESVQRWIIDPSSRKSSTLRGQGSIIDEFKKYLPYLEEGNNHNKDKFRDLLGRLVKYDQAMQRSNFYVTRACPMTHHQLLNYSWRAPLKSGEDRNRPQVLKKDEDFCDCFIYTLQTMDFDLDNISSFDDFGISIYANETQNSSPMKGKQIESFGIRMAYGRR